MFTELDRLREVEKSLVAERDEALRKLGSVQQDADAFFAECGRLKAERDEARSKLGRAERDLDLLQTGFNDVSSRLDLVEKDRARILADWQAVTSRLERSVNALRAVQSDLLDRGRIDGDGPGKVVNLSNSVWAKLCDAIEASGVERGEIKS